MPEEEATVPGKLLASANKQELAKSKGTTLLAAQLRELGESVKTEHKLPRGIPLASTRFQLQVTGAMCGHKADYTGCSIITLPRSL